MDDNMKLLVLEGEETPRDRGLESRLKRRQALHAISSSGAKVRHDSGGRLIVIEVPGEAEKALIESLPGARLVPVDVDVRGLVADLDATESLFLDALKIRTSKSYRDAKKMRKYGETPEEKQLMTGPCIKEY